MQTKISHYIIQSDQGCHCLLTRFFKDSLIKMKKYHPNTPKIENGFAQSIRMSKFHSIYLGLVFDRSRHIVPRHEKTCFLYMQKQRGRSAAW